MADLGRVLKKYTQDIEEHRRRNEEVARRQRRS
jgi:hypothetical protein